MINKFFSLYILSALFFTAGVIAFADEPSSSLDDKPSVDKAAESGVDVPAVPSDAAAADTQHTSYLYDLKKLIEKSRENIKEVNDKILEQAVLKRNQEREERSHEYYEKGLELTKEGKLDEARDYFEKAIRITEHPEMAGYIKESQRRLKREEEALHSQERQRYDQIKHDESTRKEDVEAAYREAVDLYKQKKYHPAKDAFDHVNEIAPDYRATNSYLKIIDQDIILADAMAVKKQAVDVARQQKEAEAAREKEKANWLAQIEEKEKDRKEQTEKQADDAYNQAIDLYKKKKFADAKKKFQEVSWVIPNYKDTMKYLRRIDRDAEVEQEHVTEEKEKTLKEQEWEDLVQSKKQEVLREHETAIQEHKHRQQLEEQAEFLYSAAVTLYDKKDMDDAWVKFNDIEKTCPDYKSTRSYIDRIIQSNPSKYKPVIVPIVMAAPVKSPEQIELASSMEEQQREMQEISDLSRRAADLLSKVADMGNDRSTAQMKRKMAEVDAILNKLKASKARLLGQMHAEQSKEQERETRAKQEEHRAEVEKMYQLGLGYLRAHDYEKARNEFLVLDNIIPDYKDTRHYISTIEKDENESSGQLAAGYQENEKEQVKLLQGKEKAAQLRLTQEEQEKQRKAQMQQEEELQSLAQKATSINDDIIFLSRQQDYEGMKIKFTELENTITALTSLRDSMSKQKDHQDRDEKLQRDFIRHRDEMLRAEGQESQIHTYDYEKSSAEHRPKYQPFDEDHYKQNEIKKEQNMMFSQAVDLYREKKYEGARLLFDELEGQHDRRADSWLKKVDHAIAQNILRNQAGQEKERTAFIAEQVKAQRQLAILQERERQRQKKLTEDLERQKRLYEDDRAMQIRKEQTLKAQEREREIQEEKRLQSQKENEKQEDMLRFHRIETNGKPEPAVESAGQHPELTPAASTPAGVAVSTPADLEARRKIVRKQLEEGVEAMYKEALKLYKEGNYAEAADKFKDVQDIIPGYKRAGQYMDEARQKSMADPPQQPVIASDSSIPPTSSVSRAESISKALDLFDSNVK